ncbi:hypothetical protein FHY55_14825 [Oceanicola sp. D3]|uniref:hypothetical protein n=1 Tax=Oceanicola sp. D3 TaxID=2587163 RepID=UPI00111F0B3E|nr:hypothetical protein [Oceanicola sp. D3]QDC10438.1 hypothetical protein FHY55_14825 [Oceanicola sp. D3]
MIRALALACLLPGAAAAQTYDSLTDEACAGLLQRADVLGLGGVVEVGGSGAQENGCAYSDVRISTGAGMLGYLVPQARVQIGGLGRLDYGLPPLAVKLEVRGAHPVFTVSGDALTSWLLTEQANVGDGMDLSANLWWDRDTREVVIEEVRWDFPGANGLRMEGLIAGVDLTDQLAMQQSALTTRLMALELEMESNGLFEQLFLVPLGQALLQPVPEADGAEVPSPAAQVAALQAAAVEALESLPDARFEPGAREALAAFITDLPHPEGRFVLRLDAPEGLGMAQLGPLALGAAVTPEAVGAMLDGVTIGAEYR